MPATAPQDVCYFSANDLAARYGVHVMTVYGWAKRGVLPAGELIGPNTRRWRSDVLEAHERADKQEAHNL
jgi:hypothetical protein